MKLSADVKHNIDGIYKGMCEIWYWWHMQREVWDMIFMGFAKHDKKGGVKYGIEGRYKTWNGKVTSIGGTSCGNFVLISKILGTVIIIN